MRWFPLALLLAVVAVGPARAQDATTNAPDDLGSLQAQYEYGKYQQVLTAVQARIDQGGLSRSALISLHELAGLSAFDLEKLPDAERHFTALLELSPDFTLDPFRVPPPAIQYFETLRKRLAPKLDQIRDRQRQAALAAREQAADEAAAKKAAAAEQARLEALARKGSVKTIEEHSFWIDFLPFGAGQFQEHRLNLGVALAVSQGVFAVTSIIAYLAYDAQIDQRTFTNEPGVVETGIYPSREVEARNWRLVKIASSIGFYALWAAGIVDAIYHHTPQTVTVTPAALPPLSPTPNVWVGAHGIGGGLTFHF